jgi:hypothetical protein
MEKTILILIENKLIGFWCSFAILLKEMFHVVIITNRSAQPIIAKLLDKHDIKIEVHDDFYIKKKPLHHDLINEVRQREDKYGEKFSMLLSHFRGIGKGYILNVDHVPDPRNTKWSYEEKINSILHEFIFWEKHIEKHRPELILSMMPSKIISSIAKYHGITYLGLNYAKFGERLFWIENEYYSNSKMIYLIESYLKNNATHKDFSDIDYEFVASSKYTQSKLNHKYPFAVKNAIIRILQECKHQAARFIYSGILRRQHRKYPYPFLSWLPVLFHHPYNYRYVEKKGKMPKDLEGKTYVYLSLHLEPEMALMQLSPEFTNSLEMIAWISKSLPVNHFIVVKEAPGCFGHRSSKFYEKILKMPNVVLAHPGVSSWEWIKKSVFVATITGTAGIEGIYFEKPVLSYGRHQIINYLPTVRYVSNFETTKRAIEELLSLASDDIQLKISKEALYRAQMEVSFEITGLIKHYSSLELHNDLAKIAFDHLFIQYPDLIKEM